MNKKFDKSKFLISLKDKPLWIGFIISFFMVLVAVSIGLAYKGYEYQRDYIDAYTKQIMSFPEFKINSDGLIITSGESYENVVNGMLMIVDDKRELTTLIYECVEKTFDNAILIGKNGIANVKNKKLIYYEEFANSSDLVDVEVSDAEIKMMVLDSELMINVYYAYLPILIAIFTIVMWILMYAVYSGCFWIIDKVGKDRFEFKEIVNIISYTCLVPVIVFVGYYFFGYKNIWIMGALQAVILAFYGKVFKYYNKKRR